MTATDEIQQTCATCFQFSIRWPCVCKKKNNGENFSLWSWKGNGEKETPNFSASLSFVLTLTICNVTLWLKCVWAGSEAILLVFRNETTGKLATVQVIELGCFSRGAWCFMTNPTVNNKLHRKATVYQKTLPVIRCSLDAQGFTDFTIKRKQALQRKL